LERHVGVSNVIVLLFFLMVQQKHATGFNGVDLSDKDSAKNSTSLRTNRWYLHVFFFMIDRVVYAIYIIVCALASNLFFPEWKKYKSKNNGRKKFQCHLGIALINAAIEMEWKAPYDEKDKPKWMPQTSKNGRYHPCNCGICFFCKNNFSSSIAYGKVTSRPPVVECSNEYECIKRKECIVCTEEAKKNYAHKNTKEIRKLKVDGKLIVKKSLRGCSTCGADGVAICKEHWATFDHSY
jgi:hypothetical protein